MYVPQRPFARKGWAARRKRIAPFEDLLRPAAELVERSPNQVGGDATLELGHVCLDLVVALQRVLLAGSREPVLVVELVGELVRRRSPQLRSLVEQVRQLTRDAPHGRLHAAT